MNTTPQTAIVNGIDTQAVQDAMAAMTADAAKAKTKWNVTTHWKGGARMDTQVSHYTIGGQVVPKDFTIRIDEPLELAGTNQYPNPQETLMAALNACILTGFVAVCALKGVELDELSMKTEGDIDLRGFLNLADGVKPGYDELRLSLTVKGSASTETFQEIADFVMATSPNYYNLSQPIPLKTTLTVAK